MWGPQGHTRIPARAITLIESRTPIPAPCEACGALSPAWMVVVCEVQALVYQKGVSHKRRFLRCKPAPAKPSQLDHSFKKKSEVGNFLLSQEAALQVPSADTRLTAGFGMLPGIPTLLWSPTSLFSLPIYNMYSLFFRQGFPGLARKTSLFLTPRKSLRSLLPVCSIHYCTFTSGLSSK